MDGDESVCSSMDIPELIPMQDYNAKQAKLEASISWLLTKAYGKCIPPNLVEPFYDDPQGAKYLKPEVVNVLVSGEIYCKAASNIFKNDILPAKGHQAIIQAVSRRGIYVLDARESAVTEQVLMQASPFRESSHLALIDALMTAYVSSIVTVERVVQAVKKFATFNASSELPYDTEDALLFWLNKVCGSVRRYLDAQQVHLAQRQAFGVPVLDDLMKDSNDGCCLAATISFYCPMALRLETLALRETVGVADSLYNLQVVTDFCKSHLPSRVAHLTVNDLFYTAAELKTNFLAFLADIFFYFEVEPASCVRDTSRAFVSSLVYTGMEYVDYTENQDPQSSALTQKLTGSISRKTPVLPISDLTKRSFQQNPSLGSVSTGSTPDLSKASPGMPAIRQPLLPKRLQQHKDAKNQSNRRSHSLTSVEDRMAIQQSMQAWKENQDLGAGDAQRDQESGRRGSLQNGSSRLTTDSQTSALLTNVSMDSEMSIDFPDLDSARQSSNVPVGPIVRGSRSGGAAALQELFRNPQVGDMELQSVSSRASTAHTGPLEPLMPAQLKPAKEKSHNHSKEEESGEKDDKRSPSTPSKPVIPKSLNITSTPHEDSSDSSDEFQTPSVETVPLPGFDQGDNGRSQAKSASPEKEGSPSKGFDAFFVDAGEAENKPKVSLDRHKPVAQSFTLHGQPKTPEAAEAAGIPVITDADVSNVPNLVQRMRAQKAAEEMRSLNGASSQRPGSLDITKSSLPSEAAVDIPKPSDPSPLTSFAQIKRQKENGEVSPSVLFAQQGPAPKIGSLRDQFQKSKHPKKTTFAALPNQTTWRENAAQRNSVPREVPDSNREGEPEATEGDAIQPLASELLDIRMRLAERRRQMEGEKKRLEMQWSKQRQRVGKQAFIQVISKNKDSAEKTSEKEEGEVAKKGSDDQLMTKSVDRMTASTTSDPGDIMTQSDTQVYAENQRKKRNSVERLSVSEEAPRVSPPVDKAKERLRSVSPAGSAGSQHSRESSPKPKGGTYSREAIQTMIEGGRKRWGTGERDSRERSSSREKLSAKPQNPAVERSATPRSRQASCGSPAPSSQGRESPLSRGSQDSRPRTPMNSSLENVNTYNTSLDKLNCSLSELQGEIMRLSLQQDQIKTMVNSDSTERPKSPPQSSSASAPASADSSADDSKFFLYPRGASGGEPDIASSVVASEPSPVLQQPQPTTVPQSYSMHHHQPPVQYAPPPPPHYGQGYPGQYPHYIASQPHQPPSMYPQQYPGPGYHPPMYHQYPQQPYPVMAPGPPQWQHTMQPPMHLANSHPAMPPMSSTFHHSPQSHPVTAHSSMASITGIPTQMVALDDATQTTPLSPQNMMPRSPLSAPTTPSHQHPASPLASAAPLSPSRLPKEAEESGAGSSRSDAEISEAPSAPAAPNEGFFVSFDSTAPQKAKPQLGKNRRKKKDSKAEPQAPSREGGPDDVPSLQATPQQQIAPPPAVVNVSPGVGFVIGAEDTKSNMNDMNEMEQKKRKILEQQMKRKEEAERKRMKLERERAKEREAKRLKEEQAEQKKIEDKARRDAIYQQYLERKAERENSEGDSSGSSSVPRRGKNKGKEKLPRPKSQPPGGLGAVAAIPPEFRNAPNSVAARGKSPGPEMLKYPKDLPLFPGASLADPEPQNLAYGGMTHRRPPTPDRIRGNIDNGDYGIMNAPGSDYAGPKLFVKPSSKSNRHIIANAISHCCLAGTVNTDVKNKVLDILNNDPANHFVILFRDAGMQYRALYTYNLEREEVFKIHGVGPKQLIPKMLDRFYKYNSGAKSFSQITSTKHLSATIDAVTILGSLWSKKSAAPSKKIPQMY